MNANSYTTTEFTNLIGEIYQCVSDTALWINFLEKAAKYFNVTGAQILCSIPEKQEFIFNSIYGFDPANLDNYQEYGFEDPINPYVLANPLKPWSDRRIPNIGNYLESKISQEFFQPIGITERIGFSALYDKKFLAFALLAGPDRTLFTDEELGLIGALQPHIIRAVELQEKFMHARFANETMLEILNGMPIGMAVVDRDSRVHFTNRVGNAILDQKIGLLIKHGELRCLEDKQNRDIRSCVKNVAENEVSDSNDQPTVFQVQRSEEQKPLLVTVARINKEQMSENLGIGDLPVAIVYIVDPEIQQETPDGLLCRLFGLTAAEAKTLRHLVAGDSLQEIAASTGLKLETVRSYIKQVQEKTGCRRQVELIRLVSNSPAWVSHQNAKEY